MPANSYHLQVATDANFQSIIIDVMNLGSVSYNIPSGNLSPDHPCYWRVNANVGGRESGWSAYSSFRTEAIKGTIMKVNATVDGVPWSGAVNYTLSGPATESSSSGPVNLGEFPAGTYTITYNSGGPAGAALSSISPSPTQDLPSGGTITFTLNFHKQTTSAIVVNATLDGAPWRTAPGAGSISYTITGPRSETGSTIPGAIGNCPPGLYTLVYNSGGPIGATLMSVTPSPWQNLASGGTIVFTLNFHSQAKGTITVNAMFKGEPWAGPVDYVLSGPYVDSGYSVPETFSNCPQGVYTLSYRSGGPLSAVLEKIVPAPTQNLPPGGGITFTLWFRFAGVIPPGPEPPIPPPN